jgi:hypothetical protein
MFSSLRIKAMPKKKKKKRERENLVWGLIRLAKIGKNSNEYQSHGKWAHVEKKELVQPFS